VKVALIEYVEDAVWIKQVYFLLVVAIFVSSKAPSSDFCATAASDNFEQVYDCVSTANMNGRGNPFINMGKMMCAQLQARYQFFLKTVSDNQHQLL
jgi:hypothetical protein